MTISDFEVQAAPSEEPQPADQGPIRGEVLESLALNSGPCVGMETRRDDIT